VRGRALQRARHGCAAPPHHCAALFRPTPTAKLCETIRMAAEQRDWQGHGAAHVVLPAPLTPTSAVSTPGRKEPLQLRRSCSRFSLVSVPMPCTMWKNPLHGVGRQGAHWVLVMACSTAFAVIRQTRRR